MRIFGRTKAERELDEEFQFHLEQQIDAGINSGLSPEEARAGAMRALDRITLRKEECRDARGGVWLEGILQDLRYAMRALRKSPAFTTVAILSLALGIGANTAIFSVMDILLLRPLGVKEPEQLRMVTLQSKANPPRYSFNYPMYELVRARNAAFAQTFAWSVTRFQTPSGGEMTLVPGAYASGDYFAGLGVAPELGRVFGPEDDQALGGKNGAVAVISDGLWASRFGRNRAALGQTLTLNGIAVSIIGVMPRGFFGAEVGTAPEVWAPLNLQRQLEDARCMSSPHCWYLKVMGRVKPGMTAGGVDANLSAINRGILEDNDPPVRPDRRAQFFSQSLRSEPGAAGYTGLRSRVRTPLVALMALVGLVLLIACANMANLLMARASARKKELAVRLAMGASRARVMRQLLTESLLLAVAGTLAGFAFAIWATRGLIALLSSIDNPIVLDIEPDWRVMLFAAGAAMLTGLLFGAIPAWRATGGLAGAALKERSHQIRVTGTRSGMTRALLGFQTALSVVLLSAAGLLAGSLARLVTQGPGFEPRGVTMMSIVAPRNVRPEAITNLYSGLLARIRAMPGVESATLLSTTPLSDGGWDNVMTIRGVTDIPEEERQADINSVSSRFFETLRIPILAGRDFRDSDTAATEKVALISENAARRWFPKGAVGGMLEFPHAAVGGPSLRDTIRIIGVVRDTKYMNLREEMPRTMFVLYRQFPVGGLGIAARTGMSSRAMYAGFREAVRRVAPGSPVRTVKTMEQQMNESLSSERLTAYLSMFFAGLALLLTAVGLYGILAYSVSRRTGEIGIRMALGAQRGAIRWLVVRETLSHTAIGVLVGAGIVLVFSKLLTTLLYGIKPNDPSTMVLAIAVLAMVCAAAAWIPARRATRLDPMAALREE
jgi:predicted permease